MKNKYPIILVLLLFYLTGFTQSTDLFMIQRIAEAYEKNTRNADGTSGSEYFQNTATYNMDIKVNPKTAMLEGKAEIVYINNSPDTLNEIMFRFYPNMYKKGSVRQRMVSAQDVHDGVTINTFSINGLEAEMYFAQWYGTANAYVLPQNEVLPGDKVLFYIEWSFQLPRYSHIRNGSYHETSYFISYFYPQVAVYDDIDGWDRVNFDGGQEFYNDYNNFDVTISLPKPYIAWATGELMNENEIFNPDILQKINQSKINDGIITIKPFGESKFSKMRGKNISWNFKAQQVTDFAFAISPDYQWDASSTLIDTATDKRVWVSSLYHKDTEYFHHSTRLGKKSIQLLGEVTGVKYPYHKMVIFEGGNGGMEYPMIINNVEMPDFENTAMLVSHEICHTYFPFMTGMNERLYAWMDEGLTTYLAIKVEEKLTGKDPKMGLISEFNGFATSNMKLPLMIPSNQLNGYTYVFNSYTNAGTAFYLLNDYLGEELFTKCIQQFIERWYHKHPTPYDFFNSISTTAGEDLNWFWKPWFFEFGYPDLAIDNVELKDGNLKVGVKKVGSLPVPIQLTVTFDDQSTKVISRRMDIWKEGNTEQSINIEFDEDKIPVKVELGYKYTPDTNKENNMFLF